MPIQNAPADVIAEILSHLDPISVTDAVACCKDWYTAWKSFPSLRYQHYLRLTGLVNNPKCSLVVTDRISKLVERERAWEEGRLGPWAFLSSFRYMAFAGSQLVRVGGLGCRIFYTNPSEKWTERPEERETRFKHPVLAVAVPASIPGSAVFICSDLYPSNEGEFRLEIVLWHLLLEKPHPDFTFNEIVIPCHRNTIISDTSCFGKKFAFLVHSGTCVVVDWDAAEHMIIGTSETNYVGVVLLSQDQALLLSKFPFAVEVHSMTASGPGVRLGFGIFYEPITIKLLGQPRRTVAGPNEPYHADPDEDFAISVVTTLSTEEENVRLFFFTKAGILRLYHFTLSNPTTATLDQSDNMYVLWWGAWGPKISMALVEPISVQVAMCGLRTVMMDKESLTRLDFSKSAVDRQKRKGGTVDGVEGLECVRVKKWQCWPEWDMDETSVLEDGDYLRRAGQEMEMASVRKECDRNRWYERKTQIAGVLMDEDYIITGWTRQSGDSGFHYGILISAH
ncbi:hypothetical protein H0H87_003599 [Tephrocybe sp. NHM501043]|nr:hypothetical protein H0H87_003599 [Tephrocybe sp. NHM501043]